MSVFEEKIKKGNLPYFYFFIIFLIAFFLTLYLTNKNYLITATVSLAILISFIGGDILKMLLSIKNELEELNNKKGK